LTPDCGPKGSCFGIANLTIQWLDAANHILKTLNVTDGSGIVYPSPSMSFNLATGTLYNILVTGTVLSGGGIYNFNVATTAGTDQSSVPLPPALILFGSALVGLTALGRRKRKGATV
jgi:hypothetical protein